MGHGERKRKEIEEEEEEEEGKKDQEVKIEGGERIGGDGGGERGKGK